jgi:hypothetical protein
VLAFAKANFHEQCQLDSEWEWTELLYKGSSLAKGAIYYLDVKFVNGSKDRAYMMTIQLPSFNKETQKYDIVFKKCELSPHCK